MKDLQKLQFENKNDLKLEVQGEVEVELQSAAVLSVPQQATLQYEPHVNVEVEVEVATNVAPIALSLDSMSIRCGLILNVLSIKNIDRR